MISEFDGRDDSQISPFRDRRRQRMQATAGALGQQQPYVAPPTQDQGEVYGGPVDPNWKPPSMTGHPLDPSQLAYDPQFATREPGAPRADVMPNRDHQHTLPYGRGQVGPALGPDPYGIPVQPGDPTDYFPSGSHPATPATPSAGTPPADPIRSAVLGAFTAKGLQPRDDQDLQYWINRITETGGWDGAGNQDYWTKRMAQDWGGVGDYLERPERGSGMGMGGDYFSQLQGTMGSILGGAPTLDTYQTLLSKIMQALAASGTLNKNPFAGGM